MVRKLCVLAGVPLTCTHSLRGLYATLAVQSGSASHVGASSLGHGSFEITQQHYAQAIALAADLCAHLERPVLLRIAQLLAQSYESLESKKLHSAIDPQSIRDPKMEDGQRRDIRIYPSSRLLS